MNQSLLTNFFKTGKGPAEVNKPMKKINLSLCKSQAPAKVKQEIEQDESIGILSSDDENVEDTYINLSGASVQSASSDCTIVYTPESPQKRLRNSFAYESPEVDVKLELLSHCNRSASPDCRVQETLSVTTISASYDFTRTVTQTPSKRPSLNVTPSPSKWTTGPAKETPSPSKKTKFFSPNKQRSVSLKTPNKGQRKLTEFIASKRLFQSSEDECYTAVCEGLDDKTKFLLNIVNDYLKDNSLKKLLGEDSLKLLKDYFAIPKPGLKLVCRLFWRKEGWYRRESIKEIAAQEKHESIDEDRAVEMLQALVDKGFLLAGTKDNMAFQELTSLLLADELKEICKSLGIKTQTKKSAMEALEEFCRRPSISSYFITNNDISNSERARQKMIQKAGACYRLSDLARSTLERLYHVTYLGVGYDCIREKRLELMLINEKIQRETFPVGERVALDSASVVFESKEEFDRYLFAHCCREDFLSRSNTQERCLIVRQVYDHYKNISVEHQIRYKSLPEWLQRFTPTHIYIKILDEGIKDLKKCKQEQDCLLAADILDSLIQQTFCQHKKAQWYAELALVLHSYLCKSDQAAQVLINGFESDLSEVAKDCMRQRARLIAQQKNILLDRNIRDTLLAFASKESILEGSIPSHHIFKQPQENTTKGKALYETKHDNGRVTQGVEDYACSCYILSGDFTHGYHWEGRMVITIFFLLFWDIIYTPPRRGRGIFLSRLQRFPLDLFYEAFYENRKEAVDAKLAFIEDSSTEDLLEVMQIVWDGRPEGELSGISRDVGWASVRCVCECLGARRVAALCRRLATDYRYTHSGFPDLTLWNAHTKQIKFVEVKSDSDKPSVKQIQWMQYLREHNIDTEFCYVGARTGHVKARRPLRKSAPSINED